MMSYLWTVLIGLAGALIGVKLRLPAGALVGSMVAVGLVNVWGAIPIPAPPAGIRFAMQVVLGILLGTKLTADTLLALKDLWRPALLCTVIAVGHGGSCRGYLISRWLGIERLTAILGTAPGGISDMSLIALDMGAQTSTVVVMHLARLISVVVVVPWVVRLLVQPGTS
jgi:membrane AbrB-like protein